MHKSPLHLLVLFDFYLFGSYLMHHFLIMCVPACEHAYMYVYK